MHQKSEFHLAQLTASGTPIQSSPDYGKLKQPARGVRCYAKLVAVHSTTVNPNTYAQNEIKVQVGLKPAHNRRGYSQHIEVNRNLH